MKVSNDERCLHDFAKRYLELDKMQEALAIKSKSEDGDIHVHESQ